MLNKIIKKSLLGLILVPALTIAMAPEESIVQPEILVPVEFPNDGNNDEDGEDSDLAIEPTPVKKQKRHGGFCKDCHKEYTNLYKHEWARHGEGTQLVTCDYPGCNTQVKKISFVSHKRKMHGNGAKVVSCTYPGCTEQVAAYVLNQHMDNKHGEGSKKISCMEPGCSAQVLAYVMNQHMRKAHGKGNKINCPYCNKQIVQRSLQAHVNKEHSPRTWIFEEHTFQALNG